MGLAVNFKALPRTGNALLDRIVIAIEAALGALVDAPLVQAVVLPPQTIGITDTRVYHGLGRPLRGYLLVRAPASTALFDGAAAETVDPSNFVTLRVSAAASVTIAVF